MTWIRTHLRLALALVGLTAIGLGGARLGRQTDRFDHDQHAKLFPSCTSCHAGVLTGSQPYPAGVACTICHDGSVERRVDWTPPTELPATNLDFQHTAHAAKYSRSRGIAVDSAQRCAACHIPPGKGWMQVSLAVSGACLSCHGVTGGHFAAPDTACATCHVPLSQATRLSRQDIARFPEPASHQVAGFGSSGHGRLATMGATHGVAASCATCHARNFCLQCHVDAPETPAIQALAPDPRSTAIAATLAAPESHQSSGFLQSHGRGLSTASTCATCHTRESCLTCHAGSEPGAVKRLAVAGPGRATGAVVTRRRPATHGADFSEDHAAFARAAPRTCATCHARTECLYCHVPTPGTAQEYHPAGFLTRHPAAAFARASDCAACHNTASFCMTCHAEAGLRSSGPLRGNYHDANPTFLLGHGKAARQSLETCVSCHVERDCLTCHSANGGRRFNPHGPGFDAERLRRKNPEMCTVCHGAAIP